MHKFMRMHTFLKAMTAARQQQYLSSKHKQKSKQTPFGQAHSSSASLQEIAYI